MAHDTFIAGTVYIIGPVCPPGADDIIAICRYIEDAYAVHDGNPDALLMERNQIETKIIDREGC